MESEFKISKEQFEGRETLDLIRELISVKKQWERVQKGQRGVDYYGGYDDSVANELSSLEFEICRRSHVEFDKNATASAMNEAGVTPVNSHYYAYVLHGLMALALKELEDGNIAEAKDILKSAEVNYSK